MTFALLVQDHSFGIVPLPSSLAQQGPFSVNKASWEEHPELLDKTTKSSQISKPGPPVSQTTRGSVDGADLDSKSQKK